MTKAEAQQAINTWKPILEFHKANPRGRTMMTGAGMGECNWCNGAGCIWCGNKR